MLIVSLDAAILALKNISDCAIDRDCHDDNLTCLRAKCVLKDKLDQTITENMYVSKVVKQIGIIIKIPNGEYSEMTCNILGKLIFSICSLSFR